MATRHTKRNRNPGRGFYQTDDDGEDDGLGPRRESARLSHMSEFDRDILDRDVHIPDTEFMFTHRQIATMLAVSTETLRNRIFFYKGRSVGRPKPRQIVTVNIAPSLTDAPMWRVTETEFRRYLSAIGVAPR